MMLKINYATFSQANKAKHFLREGESQGGRRAYKAQNCHVLVVSCFPNVVQFKKEKLFE